jgi:hypothetical protein
MNRIAVAGSVALAVTGALSMGLATADAAKRKKARFQNEKNLVVTLATPTLNQEVLPDLSDPGLNGVIEIRFSSPLKKRDVINDQNTFNRLTERVEFLDSTFNRMPGTPTLRRNRFIFNPRTAENGGVLAQGQYTVNIRRNVRNRRGRMLNFGTADFTTTFSVGTDVYNPVLRRMSPLDGQANIGLQQKLVASFNEPIDPSSIISSIQVQDASTNPPTPIPGAGGGTGVTLEREGFDVVFTPDPCFGYPPQTTIQFLMQGQDEQLAASPVTDVFGNAFTRDSGLQWSFNASAGIWESPNGTYNDVTGQFRTQFQTKGVTPPPQALPPGSPMMSLSNPANVLPFASPCSAQLFFAPSCWTAGRVLIAQTTTSLYEIDLTGFIQRFNQGITDFSLISTIDPPVRVGRPIGVVTDPRVDPNNFETFIYVVDQRTATVAVLDSRNLQTLGRFTGFSSPRDISISTDLSLARTTMYVSDFAANNLVAIDMQGITVNFSGQPGAQSPCEAIKDNASRRTVIQTGAGPSAVSADSFLLGRVATANVLDSSITVVNVQDNSVRGTFEVGSNPVDLDWSIVGFGGIRPCMVTNQGGLNDPDGSVSLYLQAPPLSGGFLGAGQNRDGIESTFIDGVKNPTGIWGNQQWLSPFTGNSVPIVWYVANTGGRTVLDLRINIVGLFGVSVTPTVLQNKEVGPSPTFATLDPFYPNAFLFAAVAGTGSLAAMDPNRPVPPTDVFVGQIRRYSTAFTH